MHGRSLLDVTPTDALKFIKTTDGTLSYLYLRNCSEDSKLILAKVDATN